VGCWKDYSRRRGASSGCDAGDARVTGVRRGSRPGGRRLALRGVCTAPAWPGDAPTVGSSVLAPSAEGTVRAAGEWRQVVIMRGEEDRWRTSNGCKDPHEVRQSHAHASLFSPRGAPVLPAEVRQSRRDRPTSCADPDGADDRRWVSTPMKRLARWMAHDAWDMWRRTSGERRTSRGSLHASPRKAQSQLIVAKRRHVRF